MGGGRELEKNSRERDKIEEMCNIAMSVWSADLNGSSLIEMV